MVDVGGGGNMNVGVTRELWLPEWLEYGAFGEFECVKKEEIVRV